METPKEQSQRIEVLIRRWPDYNSYGVLARFAIIKNEPAKLPAVVFTALEKCRRNAGGLNPPNAVNWNVCIMNADGGSCLDVRYLEGGSKSGAGCAEDALWVTEKGGQEKNRNVPHPNGCSFFAYSKCVYVIDAGLCPCRRCCGSLIGLARTLNSYIVVRPLVDYEFIDRAPTVLTIDGAINKHTYLLLFDPVNPFFTIYYESDTYVPKQLLSTLKPDVPQASRNVVLFQCTRGHFAKIDYGGPPVDGERLKCKAQHCTGTLTRASAGLPVGKKFTEHARSDMEEK